MRLRRHVSAAEIESSPYLLWNAFVDLLAMADISNLDSEQRPAHLAFWYDSEVQNGGHFQYFENRGLDLVPETIDALTALGAAHQANVLSQAYALASERTWGTIVSVEEFVEQALASGFADLDTAYQACNPTLLDILGRHLEANRDLYVEVSA